MTYVNQTLLSKFIMNLGEDPGREGLRDTPQRAAEAWDYWTSGYGKTPADVLKTFTDGASGYDTMVFQSNIAIYSHCEHHLAPFFGVAHIGYIPLLKVVGLSKLARVVDIFSRRLQIQERLTVQVADALNEGLAPEGVGVILQCRHMCMESRGVEKPGTVTTTSALRGSFKKEPDTRAEFMSLVNSSQQVNIL